MSAQVALHTLTIIFSTILPSLWISNPGLEPFTLQACGALTLAYIAFKKLSGPTTQNIVTLLFMNALVQTLIISTGKTASPLFFLYYFVLFAFAVTFERYQVFVITIFTIISYIFLDQSLLGHTQGVANLLSLLLISPLATLYSKAVIKNNLAKEKIVSLQEDLSKTETDSLLWLATENKPTLNSVISSITDLIIYAKSSRAEIQPPKAFINKMRSIQSDLMTLYSSADLLEEDLKSKTDSIKKQ